MSPELIDPQRFGFEKCHPTKSSDCYALGMVIYETISGHLPFHEYTDLTVFVKVLDGVRPPRGVGFADSLWRMLELCWVPQPHARPNVEDVRQCLESVSLSLEPRSPGISGGVDGGRSWDSTNGSSGMFPYFIPSATFRGLTWCSLRPRLFLRFCTPSVSGKARLRISWPFGTPSSNRFLSTGYASTPGEPPRTSTTLSPGSPLVPPPDVSYPHKAVLPAQYHTPQHQEPAQVMPLRELLVSPPPPRQAYSENLDNSGPYPDDPQHLISHPHQTLSPPSSSSPPLITDLSQRMTTVTGNTVTALLRRNAFWAHCPVSPSLNTMEIGTDFLLEWTWLKAGGVHTGGVGPEDTFASCLPFGSQQWELRDIDGLSNVGRL